MTQLRLQSSSVHESSSGSNSGAVSFHDCSSGCTALSFMAPAAAPGSVCLHTLIFSLHTLKKKNVRSLVWICRDPISLILGTRFSLTLGTRFSLTLGTRFL